MNYCFSPSTNAFYLLSLKESYLTAGTWPADASAVTDDVFTEYVGVPPEGMRRVADSSGLPSWQALPPPTEEELIAAVEQKKMELISDANDFINARQWPGKAAIGRLAGDSLTQYIAWLDYLDALQAVDITEGLAVIWPAKPY